MNSKKIKKAICLFVAMALVCVASVAGTLAVLKAQTAGVTNTFVATNNLMDTSVYEFEIAETTGTSYTVTPLATITKDPKLSTGTFNTAGVVYLEVIVSNNEQTMLGVEDQKVLNYAIGDDWEKLDITGARGGLLYVYKGASATNYVVAQGARVDSAVIIKNNTVTVNDYTEGEVTVNPTFTFYGYAVQALYKVNSETTANVNTAATAATAYTNANFTA